MTGRKVVAGLCLLLFAGLVQQVVGQGPLLALDDMVNAALGAWRQPAAINFFGWATELGSPYVAVILALLASAWLWRQGWRCALPALWLAPLGATASVHLVKLLVERPRPDPLEGVTTYGSSFPSGNAALAAALYGILAVLLVRCGSRIAVLGTALFLTGLVGLSRLVLAAHYLSDVLAGFLLGGFWLLLAAALADRNCRNQPQEINR